MRVRRANCNLPNDRINDGTGTYWTAKYTYTDFGSVATKTDARGVIITYGYDSLNRLTSISYNTSGASGVNDDVKEGSGLSLLTFVCSELVHDVKEGKYHRTQATGRTPVFIKIKLTDY